MKLKHMSLALAGMVSVQAQASEAAVEAAFVTPAIAAAPVNAVSEDDLVALFGAAEAAKPMQLAALSDAEMRETEGALWLNVARGFVGGLSGAYGYMTSAAISRQGPSTVGWGLTRAFAVGAALGAIRPVNSIGDAFGSLTRGVASGYGEAFIANRGWRF